MLQGMSTLSFFADDLEAAHSWYTELLGLEAYYVRPGYVEFRVGPRQDELGIIDRKFVPEAWTARTGGAMIFWHVDDLEAARERLLALGASEYDEIRERGEGFRTASVVDPFGNVLGVMTNPHFVEMMAGSRS